MRSFEQREVTQVGDDGLSQILGDLYPYKKTTETYRRVPAEPVDRAAILAEIAGMAHAEDARGDKGTVSGSLYCGDHDHYHFLGEVFDLYSHANVLQRDMYPSATKFEGEIIAMTSDLLHGTGVGVVTSGGSESLITALYSYREARPRDARRHPAQRRHARDRARRARQGRALDGHRDASRAAHRRLRRRRRRDGRARRRPDHRRGRQRGQLRARSHRPDRGDRGAGAVARHRHARRRLSRRLAAAVGRAPRVRGAASGTSACRASRRSRPTRTSTATRSRARACCSTATRSCASTSTSPTRTGPADSTSRRASRARAAAASSPRRGPRMLATGESGYLAAADAIMRTAVTIRDGIRADIPELEVIGDPVFLVAFKAAGDLDIYLVNDSLMAQGWRMNPLQLPPALHFCITRPNTAPGVAEAFLADAARGRRVRRGSTTANAAQVRRGVRLRRHAAGQRDGQGRDGRHPRRHARGRSRRPDAS